MHPAHVPLVGEAEPAGVGGPAHARPRRGFLGDGDGAGRAPVRGGVQLPQELHRLHVLAAAVLVGHPLPCRARVVQIQHRGHGVHAQPVDVERLQPIHRVAEQERPHLVAAVVEDQRAPLPVLAAPRVHVLVERRAVEARQPVGILGEVAGHPVEDHAEALLMAAIDEVAEVVRRAEAAGGRIEAHHLVAPRAAERMLHHRHQLEVRVAHSAAYGTSVSASSRYDRRSAIGVPPPRPEMHLVDRHRPVQPPAGRRARRHPGGVAPGVAARRSRRATPSAAAPRPRARTGRPWPAGGLPAFAPRTCSGCRCRGRARTAPRSPTAPGGASGARGRPSG